VANWTKALGGIAVLQSDYPGARELFEQSLAIHRSLDDPWGTLGSLSGLALVALEEHDFGTAQRLLEENVELLRKSGHHFRVANSLEIAARLAAAQDRDRSAARLYGAASAFRGAMAVGWFEGEAWPDPTPRIARLRTTLGEEAFSEAWAAGEAMTMSEALAYALGTEEVPNLV
jgi:Tetratricopeptide repeat